MAEEPRGHIGGRLHVNQENEPSVWVLPYRLVIIHWAIMFGLDIDGDAADSLVQWLLHSATPYDGQLGTVGRSLTDTLLCLADRITDGPTARSLRNAAAAVVTALAEARLVDEPGGIRRRGPDGDADGEPENAADGEKLTASNAETSAPRDPSGRDVRGERRPRSDANGQDACGVRPARRDSSGQNASSGRARQRGPGEQDAPSEKTPRRDSTKQSVCGERPPRRDLIYAEPVDVRLADGRRGVVRHPPFDGRVQVVLPADGTRRGCAINVPLDDLAEQSRISLARTDMRRRVGVRVQCSRRSCARTIRGWLTERNAVETTDGKVTCSLADLFNGRCPEHRRRG